MAKVVQPEQVEGNEAQDADKLSATEKTMKDMRKKLHERAKQAIEENNETDIDGIQYLFNPKSFTQTVENIFHFSFMIKKGDAGIAVRPKMANNSGGSSGLRVAPRAVQDDDPPPTQAVCSLTMQDWRQLCQAYDLKQGDLPHRRTGRASAALD